MSDTTTEVPEEPQTEATPVDSTEADDGAQRIGELDRLIAEAGRG